MEKYLFMKPVLQLISEGRFFRKATAIALRVLAIAIGFASLVGWIFNWKQVFGFTVTEMLGGIIFQLLLVIAVYMVIHAIWLRSDNIGRLPESEYTVVPIVSICLKLVGEIYASYVAVMAIAEGLFTWFSGKGAVSLFQGLAFLIPHHEDSIVGGFSVILKGELYAFVGLVLFYFLSESVIVMVDIARNIKR